MTKLPSSQIPELPETTEAVGIFQSDIIIRTALVAALADMRANPWLIDFCFMSLARDKLTNKVYGTKEIGQAKNWFMATNIEVMLGVRPADGAPPPYVVSIHLMGSDEAENTLADVHPFVSEQWEAQWAPLTDKFTPASYSALTGIFEMPANIAATVTPSVFMSVVDRFGNVYPIVDTVDDTKFKIAMGTVADFAGCFLKPSIPSFVAGLESAEFKENFAIGCHAIGEPVHLTYLHSIVVFALLRYRQSLLEARGLQRSFFSSSDFKPEDVIDAPEVYYSRYISLTGYARHVWPKDVSERVLSVTAEIDPIDKETQDELDALLSMDSLSTPPPSK